MNNSQKQLISFIDASGNFDSKDRFFGVGMLTVENPGPLTDVLHLIFQRVLAISQSYRDQKLNSLINSNKHNEAITMLRKTKRFELKYDRITPVKFSQYKEMIQLFLSNNRCRFSCMVIDRQSPSYNDDFFKNTWDAYTSYVATLITPELLNLLETEIFLVLDEIPKPKIAQRSLEETVLSKITKRVAAKYSDKKLGRVINALRIESHSNLLMQLTDVLLGCVMFDFKVRAGTLSSKLESKKERVVAFLRGGLNKSSLAGTFTVHKPAYFHVWEAEWQK